MDTTALPVIIESATDYFTVPSIDRRLRSGRVMSQLVYRHFNGHQTHEPVICRLRHNDGREVLASFEGMGWRELEEIGRWR